MNKEVPLSDIYHNLVIEIMELPENTREENLTRCREMLIRHGFTMEDCIAIEEKIRKYEPLIKFIAQSIERSLDIYLKTLTPATQKQEKFISLAEISKNISFSAKYLNLLARQGKLEAYKEGRSWLTSKEAVERYLKNRTRKRKNK